MTTVAIIRSVGGLVFDATFKERHVRSVTIFESPAERGRPIADGAIVMPNEVSISAGVSDNPLAVVPSDPFDSGAGRSKRAFELLVELMRKCEPISVQTGLALYENMIITRVTTEQDKDSSAALLFTADLKEVIIARTKSSVVYPPRQEGPTARQADAVKDKGVQQSTPVTKQSYLKQLQQAMEAQLNGS